MRSYTVEDIYNDNAAKIVEALDYHGWRGPIDDIYYIPVPEDMLEDEQKEHMDDCGPYFVALEVIDNVETKAFKMELLVRARNRMRCSCVKYASTELRNRMIDFMDDFIRELDIPV